MLVGRLLGSHATADCVAGGGCLTLHTLLPALSTHTLPVYEGVVDPNRPVTHTPAALSCLMPCRPCRVYCSA